MSEPTESVRAAVRRAIELETIPGAIVLLRHRNHVVHHEALGIADRQSQAQLAPQSVLWLASLTKPLIASAILMLHEAGLLGLEDPVARFIPEFATLPDVRIWKSGDGEVAGALPAVATRGANVSDPPHDLTRADRLITIFDLLTHTSGLQSIAIPNSRVPTIDPSDTLATYVPKLASAPLDFQPGTRWAYSNAAGFDVLARIVEIASGVELPTFLRERLFAPLRMHDTGFGLSGHPRALPLDPRFAASPALAGKRYFSGAAGLWGSLPDYATFAEMLRNDGEYLGARVLRPQSVASMTRNQIGTLFPGLNGRPRADGLGFGLSVASVLDQARSGVAFPAAAFGWDGVGTRRFWASRERELVLVMYVPSTAVQVDVERAAEQAMRGS